MRCQGSPVLENLRGEGDKVGIDLVPVEAPLGCRTVVGDLMDTGLPDSHFDAVTCLSVIEHGDTAIDRRTGQTVIRCDDALKRTNDVRVLCGDTTKIKRTLNWAAKTTMPELAARMVQSDLSGRLSD